MAKTDMVRLAKTMLHVEWDVHEKRTVRGGRKRGRQKKRWEDNVTEWTCLKLSEVVILVGTGEMERIGSLINCSAPTATATGFRDICL